MKGAAKNEMREGWHIIMNCHQSRGSSLRKESNSKIMQNFYGSKLSFPSTSFSLSFEKLLAFILSLHLA